MTAREGRLYVVGLGPGDAGFLTHDASAALEEAEDVLAFDAAMARRRLDGSGAAPAARAPDL